MQSVNRHSTVTHYQRPNMTHLQEGGTGEEVSEILFFSAKSKRRPSLIYSMQIIPVCLSIVARRKGVSATRRGGSNWTPISLLVGHPCKLFHTRMTALVYNWWSLFVRMIEPMTGREAITSRPLLLTGVARATTHAGSTTLFLNSSHAQTHKIRKKNWPI